MSLTMTHGGAVGSPSTTADIPLVVSPSSHDGQAAEEPQAVAVLLCRDLQDQAKAGLDLSDLARWAGGLTLAPATTVADLCARADALPAAAASGARRFVLGLCSQDYDGRRFQSAARQAGIDPSHLATVNLGGLCARVADPALRTEKARLLLAAAVARVRAASSSKPGNYSPRFIGLAQKLSRRSLFTLPPLQYQVVPSIDERRCAAQSGCSFCIEACPRTAIRANGGGVWVDTARCEGCGLCLAACPRDAIELPGLSSAEIEAALDALLAPGSPGPEQRGILFACQESAAALLASGPAGLAAAPNWLPVSVPCAAVLSIGCLLRPLTVGAAAVGVARCGVCALGQDAAIAGRIDYAQQLLRSLGYAPERVQLLGSDSQGDPLSSGTALGRPLERPDAPSRPPLPSLFGPAAAADGIRFLARDTSLGILLPDHPHSPLGTVALATAACTGCGACAEACHAGALSFQREDGHVVLAFDANRCTACGKCTTACPETQAQALRVARATDLARLRQAPTVLYRDQEARCETCGAPFAPLAMIRRVTALLGDEEAALADRLAHTCLACREEPSTWLARTPHNRHATG